MWLNPAEIRTNYYSLAVLIRNSRVSRPVADLYDRVEAEFNRLVSPQRHETGSGEADLGQSRWIGAAVAAELLGVSARTVERRHEEWGGEKVSGVCVFDRDELLEHIERSRRSA